MPAVPWRSHGITTAKNSAWTALPACRGYSFEDVVTHYGDLMTVQPEGYGIDKQHPEVIYVPQDLRMDLPSQTISWVKDGAPQTIKLRPGHIYVQPNGYKVEMQKHPGAPSWRLWAQIRKAPSATSPVPCQGEESRRFPSR